MFSWTKKREEIHFLKNLKSEKNIHFDLVDCILTLSVLGSNKISFRPSCFIYFGFNNKVCLFETAFLILLASGVCHVGMGSMATKHLLLE